MIKAVYPKNIQMQLDKLDEYIENITIYYQKNIKNKIKDLRCSNNINETVHKLTIDYLNARKPYDDLKSRIIYNYIPTYIIFKDNNDKTLF